MVGLLALGVWWWATMPRYRDMAGRPALLALAVYAGGRLFVEAYRDNAWLALDGIRVVQAISLAALLVALVLLARKSLRSPAVQAGE
jgi:prolipoprotein diacylglyceryltransferase